MKNSRSSSSKNTSESVHLRDRALSHSLPDYPDGNLSPPLSPTSLLYDLSSSSRSNDNFLGDGLFDLTDTIDSLFSVSKNYHPSDVDEFVSTRKLLASAALKLVDTEVSS